MEQTKNAPTFEDCCKHVAIKYGLGNLVIGHAPKYWKESADLYIKETAAERDRLKKKLIISKGALKILQDRTTKDSNEIMRLKEWKEEAEKKLIESDEAIGSLSEERDKLKEENERLRKMKGWQKASYSRAQTECLDNVKLQMLNRELLEALKYASRFLGKGVADMNYINQVIQKAS